MEETIYILRKEKEVCVRNGTSYVGIRRSQEF